MHQEVKPKVLLHKHRLLGGSGSGATAEVGVEEGVVILVSVDAEAEGYKVGDAPRSEAKGVVA